MNKANADHLCRAFPELYGERYGFACPDSWTPLLYRLSAELVAHAQRAGLTLTVTDVKEKRGELRYYADGTDDEANRLISAAELESAQLPIVEGP